MSSSDGFGEVLKGQRLSGLSWKFNDLKVTFAPKKESSFSGWTACVSHQSGFNRLCLDAQLDRSGSLNRDFLSELFQHIINTKVQAAPNFCRPSVQSCMSPRICVCPDLPDRDKTQVILVISRHSP
jgi:hypothetical protein